jgi:predicted Zn finger-like uncharacterized protein
MPDHIINCPQCQRQLRVPEEMLGRLVKCPTCSTTFTVGAAAEPAAVVPSEPAPAPPRPDVRYEPHPEPADYYPAERRPDGSAVIAPAICLMIAGFLGFVVNFGQAMAYIVAPEALDKAMDGMPAMFAAKDPAQKDIQRMGAIGGGFVFGLLGMFILIASIQMARRRTYGLAMAGAIAAMINVGNLCCCLGLPFGIWAIVVLVRPDVRAAFE